MIVAVKCHFDIDEESKPKNKTLHDAMRKVRVIEVEATSIEQGELWVQMLIDAVAAQANQP